MAISDADWNDKNPELEETSKLVSEGGADDMPTNNGWMRLDMKSETNSHKTASGKLVAKKWTHSDSDDELSSDPEQDYGNAIESSSDSCDRTNMHRPESDLSENTELIQHEKVKQGWLEKAHSRLMFEAYSDSEKDPKLLGPEKADSSPVDSDSRSHKRQKSSGFHKYYIIALIVSGFFIVTLAAYIVYQEKTREKICTSAACVKASAFILERMNQSADPCSNFYNFVCGGWAANTVIPPDKPNYGSFVKVYKHNQAILKKLLDTPNVMYMGQYSEAIHQAKSYYKSCMNETTVDDMGSRPVQELIKDLGSWTLTQDDVSGTWSENSSDFMNTLVKTHQLKWSALFTMSVEVDDKNSSANIITFQQGGLTLSSFEEYLGNDTEKYHRAFIQFMSKYVELLGGDVKPDTMDKVEDVYQFEKSVAAIHTAKEKMINPEDTYHKMTVAQLQNLTGDFINFKAYLRTMFGKEIPDSEEILVTTPDYFSKLDNVLKNTSSETLANALVWCALQSVGGYLPKSFIESAMILNKVESGVDVISPRWECCLSKVDNAYSFVTGAMYVQKMFPEEKKKEVEMIFHGVKQAFIDNLPAIKWMDSQTKITAKAKADAVGENIGYPDWIKDPDRLDKYYVPLTISDDSFFQNFLNLRRFFKKKNLSRRGYSPDNSIWDLGPSEVNAYYSPALNRIVFPAGILQKPFYDSTFPMPIKYGSLGFILGHELTHGFDNAGRHFDKYGNLKNWWSASSSSQFDKKTQCLVEQYSKFKVGDQHANGKYTLGENIADNGGLKTAYHAYQSWQRENGVQEQYAGLALNADQLFFVGFGQEWCSFSTPSFAQHSLLTDPHSLAMHRVAGVIANMPEFSNAFQCASGTPSNPENKCDVW